uniref:LIM/homeobox protein Lhx9-like isoform X2 n=1 Tax=Geotrypetes seraphini TaxID=260995 RepID=A0A6P8NV64_GEOSA|nr:LIM/homeobox protein Lhx9-like isoform X2 [Geotrypetes seraphini]
MAGGCAYRCSPLLFRGFSEGETSTMNAGQRRPSCQPEEGHQGMTSSRGSSEPPAHCAGCGGPICDRYFLFAIDCMWHLSCLRCCMCRGSLGSELTCFCKDGDIYCKDDYYRRFSVNRCARCQVGIPASEMVMRTPSAVYHVDCFSCARCGAPLRPGELFGVREGVVYCREHYQQEEEVEEEEEEEPEEEGSSGSTQTVDSSALELLSARPPRRGRGRWRRGHLGLGNPATGDQESTVGEKASPDSRRQRRSRQQPPLSQKTKRIRTCFKNHQLRTLESYFSVTQNPHGKDWERMARKTGLPKRVLQNARAKLRKTLSQEGSPEAGGAPPGTPEGAPSSPPMESPARVSSGTPEQLFPLLDLRGPYTSPSTLPCTPIVPLFLNFDLRDPLREVGMGSPPFF